MTSRSGPGNKIMMQPQLPTYRAMLYIISSSLFILLLTACGSDSNFINSESILAKGDTQRYTASWNAETKTLVVKGVAEAGETSIPIHDASDQKVLGEAMVQDDGTWVASASTPACQVHIELANGTQTIAVQNAPGDCGTNDPSIAQRALADTLDVTANPVTLSTIPNAIITSPSSDRTISIGQSVEFEGTAIGSSLTPPISFFWNFGSAAPNTTVQNPGRITFNQAGVYFIQLSAADSLGIPDPTPATRVITVTGSGFPGGNFPGSTTPVPQISSPIAANGRININVGESLFFSGSASDGTGSSSFSYEWNFSGASPARFGATPGSISFFQAGTYVVTLSATNAQGIRSAIPATITVNVGNTTAANQAPSGSITRPRNDITIQPGDSVNFQANGRDPDNSLPLLYSWDFGGAAPNIYNSSSRDGGNVTFNTPGIFYVTMRVTDALGLDDPNPPVRVITVAGNTPPPNGTLTGQITSPPTDVSISPGQSVFFSGQAPGAAYYFWTFDGAAPDSNLQTPGSITFPLGGQYLVQFLAVDAQGNLLGQPTTRTITVLDPSQAAANIVSPVNGSQVVLGTPVNLIGNVPNNGGFNSLTYRWTVRDRSARNTVFESNQLSPGSFTPTSPGTYRIQFSVRGVDAFGNPTIDTTARAEITVIGNPTTGGGIGTVSTLIAQPAQDMVVNVGNVVNFQAAAIQGSNVRYIWDFNNAAPPSQQPTPPPVTFTQPGTYVVRLAISGTSFNGTPINQIAQRVITVVGNASPFPTQPPFPGFPTQPPVTGAASPEGIIDQPTSNITIRVGTAVQFSGRGFDPLGSNQLYFQWSFGGAAPNIMSQYPGSIAFNRVGTYVVSLLVINANGQYDPTPSTVVVSVTP